MKKWFVQNVFCPPGATKMEEALAEAAREINRHLIQEKPLGLYVKRLQYKQENLHKSNPRWRLVDVKVHLRPYPYTSAVSIGSASIILEEVKGEWPPLEANLP